MILGFTGSRTQPTDHQLKNITRLLVELEVSEIHLGDCVGADHAAYLAARDLGIYTVGHPPTNNRLRAFCEYDEEREPLPYITRNHCIVDACEKLMVVPNTYSEKQRSGTWATYRYGLKTNKPLIIVWPRGKEEEIGYL